MLRFMPFFFTITLCLAGWAYFGQNQTDVVQQAQSAVNEYRQIAVFQTKGYMTQISTRGFVSWVDDFRYQFRDWQGNVLWEVTVRPTPLDQPWHEEPHITYPGHRIGLSPDGHFFASITTEKTATWLEIWHDGSSIAVHHFSYRDDDPTLLVLNDGRVFFWGRFNRPYLACLVQGQKVIASGYFAHSAKMTPDGSAVIWPTGRKNPQFRYARCRVRDHRLVLANAYTGKVPLNLSYADDFRTQFLATRDEAGVQGDMTQDNPRESLFQQGRVLAADGSVFGPKGRISSASGWRNYEQDWLGNWAEQYRGGDLSKGIRLFSPVTLDAWDLPLPQPIVPVLDFTDNGQFALVWQGAPGKDTTNTLVLFERPGTIRAVLPIALSEQGYPLWDGLFLIRFHLSPDGNALLINVIPYDTTMPTQGMLFQR